MLYKLFTHEKIFFKCLLLVILCGGLLGGLAGGCQAQSIPGNNCKQYVYDSRTYGIRYHRIWADSLLSFAALPDTIRGDTCGVPSLYSTGPALLWWFDGQRNYELFPSSGGGLSGAANGCDVAGSNVILGYATDVPSLYRSVGIKTGQASFTVNADSTYETSGTDTITGGFISIGAGNYGIAPGGAIDVGYKDQSPTMNLAHFDGFGANLVTNFSDGNSGILALQDTSLDLQLAGTFGPTMALSWLPTPTTSFPLAFAIQATGGMLFQTSDAVNLSTNPSSMVLDTQQLVQLPPGPGGNGNFFLIDGEQTTHVSRLAVNSDEYLNPGGSITAEINGLGVPAGPTGYKIDGYNAGFLITFRTGSITGGQDSTEAIIRLSFTIPAEANYIVTPVAYNSAAGRALAIVQPYMVQIDNQTFELHGADSNWSGAGFLPDTYYTFAFTTVDIGTGTYGSMSSMSALRQRGALAKLKAMSARRRTYKKRIMPIHEKAHR